MWEGMIFKMKSLKRATIIVAIISVFYVVSSYVLSHTGLSYRMWVSVGGGIITTMVLPLLVLILLGNWVYQKLPVHKLFKIFLGIAAGGAYVYWLYFAVFLLAFSTETEKLLTDNLLIVNKGFMDPYYVYYRPFALFLRVPGELKGEDKVEYLEKKYNRDFDVVDEPERAGVRGEVEKIFDKEYPEIAVSVYLSGMGFADNYVEGVAKKYLEEGCQALGIMRDYYVSEDYSGRSGWIYMELAGETDMAAFAGDASKLLQYAVEGTDFWENHRGVLCFYSKEGEQEITGSLPFGKLGKWDEVTADYYLDVEQIEDFVAKQYQEDKDFQKQLEEDRQKYEKLMSENSAAAEGEAVQETRETVDVVREAAQGVYNAVLAAEGYSCEEKYDARGNLYLDLGSRAAGEPEDKSNNGTYHFSLVYDRTSQNGACELFVLYKEHYTEAGSNDGTAILDMYAVETATGKVIAADKQSWSDVGCEAYRTATGE